MDSYRSIGFKLTPQRIAILKFLEGNKEHPSAEAIHKAMLKRFPTMSFATVYTTLAALKKKGVVAELTIDPHKKRYDPDAGDHDHLLCVSCGRIFDIPAPCRPDLPAALKQGFSITRAHIEFHGLCPKCKTTKTMIDQGGSLCA